MLIVVVDLCFQMQFLLCILSGMIHHQNVAYCILQCWFRISHVDSDGGLSVVVVGGGVVIVVDVDCC